MESLNSAGAETEEDFLPRQVRTWADNPEQLYSAAERRRVVEQRMLRLPAKYRVVLVLRDIEQLSTEEAAIAARLGNSRDKESPVPGASDVARSAGASLHNLFAIGANEG